MKVLITGDKGFVGSAFRRLIEDQHQVEGYDLPYDILDRNELVYAIGKNDVVVHFAAIADLYDTVKDMDKNFRVNVEGTYNIGMLCGGLGVRLIYISTCCVYGNCKDDVINEDSLPATNEPYATSKLAGEWMLKGIPNLNYCILRIGTVYGQGMRKTLFNHIVIDKISKGERITIFGNGKQTRQYVYIDDLCEGIAKCLEVDLQGQIINLCGLEKISVLDTINVVRDITGKPAKVKYDVERYGEIHDENISSDKAYKLLGWYPKTNYKEGMKEVCRTLDI